MLTEDQVEDILFAAYPFWTARDLLEDWKRNAHHDELDALGICPKHNFNSEKIVPIENS